MPQIKVKVCSVCIFNIPVYYKYIIAITIECVDLTDCNRKAEAQEYWLPTLQLLMVDYKSLVGGDWLTDNVINAAQKLLKQSYPHVGGLQITTRGEVLSFDIETAEFVQILNISGVHWITISTIGCSPGDINIFDSLPTIDLPKRAKEQIAAIVCTPKRKITLHFQAAQIQVGGNDCGVFSIAFATSLCIGINPSSMSYHQDLLRKHLSDCLVAGKISPFPGKPKKPNRPRHKIKLCVYCKCRQPEDGRMVQCGYCKDWFHEDCEVISKMIWEKKNVKWFCSTCKN